jgi:hypothetical protein
VVQVQRHRDGRGLGHRARGQRDRQHVPAVEIHRVLADLQDDRQPGPFGARDDALGVLERDDVERRDGPPLGAGPGEQRGGGTQGHPKAVLTVIT